MDESVNRNRYDSQEALIREIEADRDTLRTELEAAQRRLEVACHVKAEDKVGFDFAVLNELAALREQVAEFKHKQNAIEQYIKEYPAGEDADPEMRSFHTAIKNIFAGKYDDLWRPRPLHQPAEGGEG
jgi:hypothetical protein